MAGVFLMIGKVDFVGVLGRVLKIVTNFWRICNLTNPVSKCSNSLVQALRVYGSKKKILLTANKSSTESKLPSLMWENFNVGNIGMFHLSEK